MAPEGEERRRTDRRRGDRREGERREGDRRRKWQREQVKNTVDAWEALKAERKEAEQEPQGGLFRRKRQA